MIQTIKNAEVFTVGTTYEGYGEVKGIDFELIDRKNDTCVFKRSDGYFEVVALTHQKEGSYVIQGNQVNVKEKEVYPSGESWTGRCVKSKDRALELLNTIA